MNEGEILTLFFGEPGLTRHVTGIGDLIHQEFFQQAEPDEHTILRRVDGLVKLTEHDSLSRETVRRRLAENSLKPWRKDMWCIPKVDAAYVAAMDDVLDLYASEPDPKRPSFSVSISSTGATAQSISSSFSMSIGHGAR